MNTANDTNAARKEAEPIILPYGDNLQNSSFNLQNFENLDLRSLHQNKKINEQSFEEEKELIVENINFSLGLLSYATGLFGIAYWVLISHHWFILVAGLAAIALGVRLFLFPWQTHKNKAETPCVEKENRVKNFFLGIKM